MLHVEAFLSCILIAAIGSAAPEADFSVRANTVPPAFKDILGPSFPNDTVYVQFSTSPSLLTLSIMDVASLNPSTLANCKYEATSRGGHFFTFTAVVGKCNVGTLQFPLCRTKPGPLIMYIQPQFLTDGTVNDGAIVENFHPGVLLQSYLSNPGDDYGTFRVQSPTIFDFPGYYTSAVSISKQTIFTDNGTLVAVNDGILVDPVCYTNSSCGLPFVYPSSTVPANLAYFNDYCGNVVKVTRGQPLYLLSHEGIGCQYFPNSGYGPNNCRVNYRGFSDAGLIITVVFVNFVDGDNCDGFSLSSLTYNTQSDTTATKYCNTSVTEILSPVPRGRIDFRGSAITGRPKYGFIIKLSDA